MVSQPGHRVSYASVAGSLAAAGRNNGDMQDVASAEGSEYKMLDTLMRRLALPADAKAEVVRPRGHNGRHPSVSVHVPCYNYGHYLPQCVNSALDQPDVRVDVDITDDASTDGTDQVVRRLVEQDPRIHAIFHTKNQGNVAGGNEWIPQATGDYVVFLSADDLLTPGCLSRATALMDENPSVGLTYGSPIVFTDEALPPARTNAKSWIIWQGSDWIMQACKTGHNPLKCPEIVIRTSVLHEIGGFRPELPHAGDFEMWMRAATISDVGYIVGADQGYYRIHGHNMHHKFSVLDDLSDRLGAFDAIFSDHPGLLKDADSMRDTAHRTIARIALNEAVRATAYRAIAQSTFRHVIGRYSRGVVNDDPVDNYTAFALKAWPDARKLKEWQTLEKLINERDSPPNLGPSLVARMAMRKLRTRNQLWRRRWTGV